MEELQDDINDFYLIVDSDMKIDANGLDAQTIDYIRSLYNISQEKI